MIIRKFVLILLFINLTACSLFYKPEVAKSDPPPLSDINVRLGLAYLQEGDMQRAKQRLLLAEQEAPGSIAVQDAMGYFLESTGNFPQASVYYQRAIRLNPNSGVAQNNYATFLCRRGQYKKADQHFLIALKDLNYLNTAQVYENAGLCALKIPNETKAMQYFYLAVKQDPMRTLSWLELGKMNYEQKNYQQAQQYFDRYMQLTKSPSATALLLGTLLERALGNEDAAGRYALMLQTRYPHSEAYKALMKAPKLKNKRKNKQLYY